MEFLLLKYGYLIMFLGIFLEGEAFLLAAAFLCNRGYFRLPLVVLVAVAANTLGGQFYYLAARVRGRQWFENRFGNSPRFRRVLTWMNNYGNWVLLLSRFAFGFRIVIPAACGAFGMAQSRFFVINLAAGLIWAIPTALVGYYFGTGFDVLVRRVSRFATEGVALAFLLLAIYLAYHHWRKVMATFQRLEWSDLHGLFPFVIGATGVLNFVSALLPRQDAALDELQEWLPLEVTQESRTLMLFAGIVLLQVARSLARRKQTGWYVAVIALSISLMLHFTGGFDLQHSLVAGSLLFYLIYFRRRFYARSDPASMQRAFIAAPLLTLMVYMYAAMGLDATQHQFRWFGGARPFGEAFRAGVLILEPHVVPLNKYASRFLDSIQVAGWLSRVYILVLLLRPVVLRDRQEAPKEAVQRLFAMFGGHSTCAFAIQPDKHHLLLAEGRGLSAFATAGAVAIACGDPMSSAEDFSGVVTEFTNHCVRHGWTPSLYLCSEDKLPVYHSLGFASQAAAEEAIINFGSWDAERFAHEPGPETTVLRYDRSVSTDLYLDEQLEEVTEDWLETRHIGEMGFTIGHFSIESLSDGPVFVLKKRQRIEAFCGWLPYRNGTAMVLDLMRQRHSAPPYAAQMLVAESLRLLKESGIMEVSLSTVPVRPSGEEVVVPVDRDLVAVFQPRWENRYIVYPRGAALARINYALQRVQFGRFRSRRMIKR
jgi:phosphatidylglycerol lysyltransferase